MTSKISSYSKKYASFIKFHKALPESCAFEVAAAPSVLVLQQNSPNYTPKKTTSLFNLNYSCVLSNTFHFLDASPTQLTSSHRLRIYLFTIMTGTHIFEEIPVTCAQVNACAYLNWSPYFKDYVPSAKVFKDLPQPFLEYLQSESIRLPPPKVADEVRATSDNEYSDWEDEESLSSNPVAPFLEFHEQIECLLRKWKKVFVKLNWSAPKDAKWIIVNNTLECSFIEDVYLLLNASDHTAHDMNGHIYDECEDKDTGVKLAPELVIKKFIKDFNPALEFRVFVKGNEIVGVSQRDLNHYQFLETLKDKIHSTIAQFHEAVLLQSEFPLRDYIMDVYIASPYEKVAILDINPFTRKWDALLFTWLELLEKDKDGLFEVRLITETNMGALARRDHSESQVPIEVVDALLNSDAMVELAREWQKLQ